MVAVDPADMVLFVTVVRERGFSAAARRLRITKQSVSERVAKLEGALKVRLLSRTTRVVSPTAAGAAYFERCSTIASQIEEANQAMHRLQTEPVGLVRVSASPIYARTVLNSLVPAFGLRHPSVRLEVLIANRRVDVVEEGFDVAVRVGALADSSLSSRKLGVGRMHYVASPSFIAAHGQPTVKSLARARTIGMTRPETWRVLGASIEIDPWLVVNDLDIMCHAAIDGSGIARLPSLLCASHVRARRLAPLFDGCVAAELPIHAVFPSRHFLVPAVRAFIDALVAHGIPDAPLGSVRQRSNTDSRS